MKFDKSILKKWWFWVISILVIFAMIGIIKPQSADTVIVENSNKEEIKEVVKEVKEMTLEETIIKEIGKKTNNKKQVLKEILPVDNTIIISLNINDNVSSDYIKKAFLINCNKILKIMVSQPYQDITIKGYLDFIDKNNKTSNELAYSLQLTNVKLQDFVFDNNSYNKLEDIADKFIIHGALK